MPSISSFDVFDTCLTRTFAYPADLFEEVGEISEANKWIAETPREFMAQRIAAENAARRSSSSGEIVLADIYRQLALELKIDAPVTSKIQEMELEIEELSIRPIVEMRHRVSLARQQGRQILFLSDMYLPASFLERMLRKHDFFQDGDVLHVSGEAGRGKRDGGLFEHARDLLKTDFRDWHHVGDNIRSDVEAPRQLGIIADHFEHGLLNCYELQICPTVRLRHRVKSRFMAFTRLNRLAKFSQWNPQGQVREKWQSRLAAAMRMARLSKPEGMSDQEKLFWDIGADVAGPLAYGHVNLDMGNHLKCFWPESSYEKSLVEALRVSNQSEALHNGALAFSKIYTHLDDSDDKPDDYRRAILALLQLFREDPVSAEIEAWARREKS